MALIAVAGQNLGPGEVRRWAYDSVGLPATYIRALQRAGGQEAILMPTRGEPEEIARKLDPYRGLLLIGGGDVDPRHYGQDPMPEVYGIDSEADVFEMHLVRGAVARGMPVLAICRGFQVMNVALGGSLHQHITDRAGLVGHGTPRGEPEMHPVELEPGSLVAKAMGADRVDASSSHHQAIDHLGEDLEIVGRTEDGVPEAIQHRESPWTVGVQWHPERTADRDPAQRSLFQALVEQAGS